MRNKKLDLIKNTLIIALGSLSVQFVSFLLLPFYTGHLSTNDYGVFDLITTYSILLTPIVSVQLGLAAFRFLIDARENEEAKAETISTVLKLCAILALFFTATATLVVEVGHIQFGFWAIGTILTSIISGVFLQFARGLGKNHLYAIASIIAGTIAITLNLILISDFHMGVRALLLSGIVGSTACSLFLFFALKLYRYIRPSAVNKKTLGELIRYAWPLVPNGISWWVIDASDRTIISIVLGVASNGIYAVAYKFPTLFSTVFSFFSMSWSESASVHINSEDRDKFFSEISSASVRFFGALASVMVAYIALFFNIFIGKNYHAAYMYIPILISASFFNSLVGIYSAVYIAKKLTRQVANTSVFAAVINLLLSIVSVKFIGMYGTAIATAIAYLAMAVYRHYDTKKYITLEYEKNVFLKVALLFALTSGLYYYNSYTIDLFNVAFTSVIAVVLNRSAVHVGRKKLLRRLKKLTPDQEVAEETL